MSHRGERAAVAALLFLMLALELLSSVHLSVTYDEPGHLRYGLRLLHGDASRFDDSKMPVSALNALPRRLAEALPPGLWRGALASWTAARLPTMLASLLLALVVWRWSRRLWGPIGALLSLLLTLFDPNLLAHARLVTTDVWIALAVLLVLYLAWRCANEPTPRRALLLTLALGAAQAVKYSAVLLVPLLLVLALVRWGPELWAAVRRRARPTEPRSPGLTRAAARGVAWAILFLLVGLLVVNAAFLADRTFTRLGDYPFRSTTLRGVQQRFPALAGVPLPVPYPWLEGLDWVHERERTGEGFGRIYLRGELREHGGFRGYYLWAWLYKVPLATMALLFASLVVAWKRRRELSWRRDLAFLLLPPLLLAIHLNFFFRAQMGVRYSLLLFPPLYVFCGVLVTDRPRRPRRFRVALAVAFTWLVVSDLSWHPFYLSYFNEMAGDRAQTWRLLADSNLDWGGSEWYIRRWLQAHPEATLEPPSQQTGRVVVRANFLTGVLGDDRFAWLRPLRPAGTVAASYVVFDVRPQDLPPVRR